METVTDQSESKPRDRPSLSRFHAWPWVAFVLLCVIQLGLLTTAVEFRHGLMASLAGPRLASMVLLTAALLAVLCGAEMVRDSQGKWQASQLVWLGLNCGLFFLLYRWTKHLADNPSASSTEVLVAFAWGGLSLAVALTATLSFFGIRFLFNTLKQYGHYFFGAFVLAAGLTLCTSTIQQAWYRVQSPTLEISRRAIDLVEDREGVVLQSAGRDPLLGIRGGASLRVTRFCAEMESFAAFWLLGIVLALRHWGRIRPWHFLALLLLGTGLLLLANGLRLAFLVEIAEHIDTTVDRRVAVSLAHSRWSGMFFLAFSLIILLGTARFWRISSEQDSPS